MLNLVINARDAMPGGGHLTVGARNLTVATGAISDLAAGDCVLVSVSDTGAGVPADILSRVLSPSSRQRKSAKAPGLGYRWSVRRLKEGADRQELVTKRHFQLSGRVTGSRPFTRGHLYCLLSNVLYVGEVSYKGTTYPGRHEAIIDRETFEAVQRQLTANTPSRRSPKNARAPSPSPVWSMMRSQFCSSTSHSTSSAPQWRLASAIGFLEGAHKMI